MKTEIKEISPTQKELSVEIGGDILKAAYDDVSNKYARSASVPGFRKGSASLDVVRLRYKEEIKNEVLQKVVPDKVAAAIEEHNLHPLSEPHMHLVDAESVSVTGKSPIRLNVHVEVMPEIPSPKYEGIELTRRVKPVDDSEIEDLIAERLQNEAALIPVDGRLSEIGDTVIADLEGTFDDDPNAETIRADNLEVLLGDTVIEAAFTENLLGVKPDDEKVFTVAYPSDFSSEALAGKTVHYKAAIRTVGRSETPELNDEWAKSLDEGYESLQDLRGKLRADLQKLAEADADARVRNEAIAKLIENNAFEVPKTLIESQARNLLNNFARDLQNRGVDLQKVDDGFIQMAFEQMRSQAERDVRGAILLDKVGEAENVSVEAAEVEAEIEKLAEHYRTTPDAIRQSLEREGGAKGIENSLRTRKAIEALIAKARIAEGEWQPESSDGQIESEKPADEEPAKPKRTAKSKAAKSKASESES